MCNFSRVHNRVHGNHQPPFLRPPANSNNFCVPVLSYDRPSVYEDVFKSAFRPTPTVPSAGFIFLIARQTMRSMKALRPHDFGDSFFQSTKHRPSFVFRERGMAFKLTAPGSMQLRTGLFGREGIIFCNEGRAFCCSQKKFLWPCHTLASFNFLNTVYDLLLVILLSCMLKLRAVEVHAD